MRVALIAIAFAAIGCLGNTKPCRSLPLPPASVFERCGGMMYHAPPGASTDYKITFTNKVSDNFEVASACVLLDGAPIFDKGAMTWSGKIEKVRHTVEVQITFKPKKDLPGFDVTKTWELHLRAAQEIAASDGAELELIATENEKADKPDQRLSLTATLPSQSKQPRCE
jgi:hypothetical protein